MKLFNSLSGKVEEFTPLKPGRVGLYTCGPTVYDHVHIGNLRTYIFEDTLRRVLKLNSYKVNHVMNLTDVDDKTIKRSQQQYPKDDSKAALTKLTHRYEAVFFEDAGQIGIDFSGTKFARATEHIAEMNKLVNIIPNYYLADDGVYFDIKGYPQYGVLVKLDQHHVHHRIRNDEYDKEHVADFALWKAAKAGEPAWDFEVDGKNIPGHPGWHIECSAMSTKYLGQPFDIHTGGVDLKFPHHENEIAQSKAANGVALANYFLHGEHLLVEGRKMAKSAKNFYTLSDITKKGIDPMAFRLLALQAHYRSQLNFTWKSLEAAQKFLQSLYAMADRQFQASNQKPAVNLNQWFVKSKQNLRNFLNNDLDTPKALAWVAEVADFIESNPIDKPHISGMKTFLEELDELFGLGLSRRLDISSTQKQLIISREAARQKQDFAKADKIRQDLQKQGVGLNDNPYGVTWYRIIS